MSKKQLISLVIPCYRESDSIGPLHDQIQQALSKTDTDYEIVFVDDGSPDDTVTKIQALAKKNSRIRLIEFSKNFGKEAATSAGINKAVGDAIIVLDADGQHPVELLPDFIKKWQSGSKLVIGIRETNKNEGFIKKYGSKLFYLSFNRLTGTKLIPGSTDYRLIDKSVQREFNMLSERNRITRGLIDWLGFERDYIYFHANERIHGEASYTTSKLIKLAINSFISLSFTPLFIMGYFGLIISLLSLFGGGFMVVEDLILQDPLGLHISGSGYVGVLLSFLAGLILISQAIVSIYISHIYTEVQGRPLYITKD